MNQDYAAMECETCPATYHPKPWLPATLSYLLGELWWSRHRTNHTVTAHV